jgi:hypothetical protein
MAGEQPHELLPHHARSSEHPDFERSAADDIPCAHRSFLPFSAEDLFRSSLAKNCPEKQKPAGGEAGGFGVFVRVPLDHARTQTTSLRSRLTRFRLTVLVPRVIIITAAV